MAFITLDTKIEELTRVGKTVSGRLRNLGVSKASDLLFYFPYRYLDYSKVVNISDLKPEESVTVRCTLELIKNRRSFQRRTYVTEALVSDGTGTLQIVWFNQPYLTKTLKAGDQIFLSGELNSDKGQFQFISPMYEHASGDTIHTARIVPMYPLTKNITHKQLRFLIKQVIHLADNIQEWMPDSFIKKYNLSELAWSLYQIHFPKNQDDLHTAERRLKFNELFVQQIKVQKSARDISKSKSHPIAFKEEEIKRFTSSLPFTLTRDQKVAAWQILQDIRNEKPMNRLIEGDVGSGKTVVATIAALNCALNSLQTVIMAPTEVLAMQHYEKISLLLKEFDLRIALLTRSNKIINGENIHKKILYEKTKNGEADIIIGTHALISEDVFFKKLGIVIIDEQHRFGVEQRKLLTQKTLEKKHSPHFLSMTATPIPRSLSLALYGDLDISIIKEMPKGRKKIITKVIYQKDRMEAYEFLRERIKKGEQAFVICPLIDPSDKLGVKSVNEEYKKIKKDVFPEFIIDFLHGKLKSQEKEDVMRRFKNKEIHILVATSVIEVGIDVPNATIMIIEGADRFGLSQLHQFRGRVGRSDLQSYCFLFSQNAGEKTKMRLHALMTAKDSFELSQMDLDLRGPGDVYGSDQSGFPEFKLARLTDVEIMKDAKSCAQEVMDLSLDNFPLLREVVEKASEHIHFE